jgi:hypothetical protein
MAALETTEPTYPGRNTTFETPLPVERSIHPSNLSDMSLEERIE